VEQVGRDHDLAVLVPEHEVGVGADGDRAFPRVEPVDPRGVGRGAFGPGPAVSQRQARPWPAAVVAVAGRDPGASAPAGGRVGGAVVAVDDLAEQDPGGRAGGAAGLPAPLAD